MTTFFRPLMLPPEASRGSHYQIVRFVKTFLFVGGVLALAIGLMLLVSKGFTALLAFWFLPAALLLFFASCVLEMALDAVTHLREIRDALDK